MWSLRNEISNFAVTGFGKIRTPSVAKDVKSKATGHSELAITTESSTFKYVVLLAGVIINFYLSDLSGKQWKLKFAPWIFSVAQKRIGLLLSSSFYFKSNFKLAQEWSFLIDSYSTKF